MKKHLWFRSVCGFFFYQDSLPLAPGGMHCINLYLECGVEGDVSLNSESSAFAWIGPGDLKNYGITFGNDEALRWYWDEKSEER